MATECTHRDQIRDVTPSAQGCEDCLKIGAQWTLLRMCLICGHVGCCNTSRYRHATAHFHATGHPIVKLLEEVDETDWCYVDEVYIN